MSLFDHLPMWAKIALICIVGYVVYEMTLFIRAMVMEELTRRREDEDTE